MALEDTENQAQEPVDLKAEMGAIFDEANKAGSDQPPVSESGAPSEPEGKPSEVVAPDARPRGPDGKFLKADKLPEIKPAAAAPVEAAPAIDPAVTAAAPTSAPTAPKSWKSEHRDLFSKADKGLQDYILQREGEMEKGVAQLRERFAPIEQALAPIANELAMRGLDPAGYIRSMIAADYALRQNGPQALQAIARQYGIDLARMTQAPADQPPADPQFAALHQELQNLRQLVNSQQANQSTAQLNANMALIDRFAADPANKFFRDVESAMLELLPVIQKQMPGQSPESHLKEAYERAIYFDPTVRAKLLAEQSAEAERKRADDAKAKATEAARVAGTNLSSRGSPSGSPSTARTQKETLAEIYDASMKGAA